MYLGKDDFLIHMHLICAFLCEFLKGKIFFLTFDPWNFFFTAIKKNKKNGLGASIRIGWEIQCLPYAGLLVRLLGWSEITNNQGGRKFLPPYTIPN